MNKCKYIQPINSKVRFGIDLKEIYPPWYLHPALKNLIYLAQVNIRNKNSTRFDIETILGKGNSETDSVKERLKLKQCLISGTNILEIDVAPGTPLWLIRHFVGLLPTPIFAPKSDKDYWFNISMRHYEPMLTSIKKRSSSEELKDVIAFELAHLPNRNLTFLFELFELIRFLSMKSFSDDYIDRRAATLLVRYYTPALFVRPYRPGILTKDHKKYITFILFTVHFWPEIRIKIHDLLKSSFNKNTNKFYYFNEECNNNKLLDSKAYLKDIGTQTERICSSHVFLNFDTSSDSSFNSEFMENKFLFDKENDNEDSDKEEYLQAEEKNIISSTPNKYMSALDSYPDFLTKCCESIKDNNCTFLKNISVQTIEDLITVKPTKISLKTKPKIRKRKKVASGHEVVVVEIPNNRAKKITVTTYKKCGKTKVNKSRRNIKRTKSKPKSNSLKTNAKCSFATFGWSIDSNTGREEFIPDVTKKVVCNPCPNLKPPTDMYGKITKYGWTYTRNNNPSDVISNVSSPHQVNYENDLKSLSSDTPLTDSVKIKKSFINFKKVSSKFNFLKIFTQTKHTVKKSLSCDDITSNVKYEKIVSSAKSF